MKESIYNICELLQANSNVLWNAKLLATFQVIINKILRSLINEGKVAVFVNNILVGMKIEKGHDKIVEKVLRRLKENNLYIKPKKYV